MTEHHLNESNLAVLFLFIFMYFLVIDPLAKLIALFVVFIMVFVFLYNYLRETVENE